jgi:hypothetical protein
MLSNSKPLLSLLVTFEFCVILTHYGRLVGDGKRIEVFPLFYSLVHALICRLMECITLNHSGFRVMHTYTFGHSRV